MQSYTTEDYHQRHKKRLSYMPWLYSQLKSELKSMADLWQKEYQAYISHMETVIIGRDCFIAPEAQLFAEPGRPIILGDKSYIAADSVIHGPVTIGKNVSINHHVTLDGGRKGIQIGDHTRIAAYVSAYAFNHGMEKDRLIHQQPVTSSGIVIGEDVWIGTHSCIRDGVCIGNKAIVGMGSVVTRNVDENAKVAGNPAELIGHR